MSFGHQAERAQLDLFRALPGDLAPRDAQDLMAYPFFSLAKSKRLAPIDFKAGSVKIRVEAVAENRQLREVSRVERVPCRHIESRCTRRSFGIADLHHLRICEDDLFECTLRQGVGERLVR